jgi:flagellar hook-associated protein 1 FlgK
LPGTFFGIEIGLRGLRVQQQALNVTAHNVANAAAPGYSRQEARIEAAEASSQPGQAGQMGSGVTIAEVRRFRDVFLDAQARKETSRSGRFETLRKGLDEIQTFFNELSDLGLRVVLDRFWDSLQDLANNPESDAVRRTVVQAAEALAATFRHLSAQMRDLAQNCVDMLRVRGGEIEQTGREIASLNARIAEIAATPGEQANDLKDKRDLLLDRLSSIVAVSFAEDETSQVRVSIAGQTLVSKSDSMSVSFAEGAGGLALYIGGVNIISATHAQQLGGEIGGALELVGRIEDTYLAGLDSLAAGLIQALNSTHRAGWGLGDTDHVERDLFSGQDADSIAVSAEIRSNPSHLAASSGGLAGDGRNALEMAGLDRALTMSGGTATFADFLSGLTGRLGIEAQEAGRFAENSQLLIREIDNHRDSVQGVSLDEEMANMVRFQHAYTACARLITVLDALLETLVERTGISGR